MKTLIRPRPDPFSAGEILARRATSAREVPASPPASDGVDGVGTAPGAATLPCGSCGRDMPADEMEPLEDHRRQRWYRCFPCRDAADARWREAYGENFHELDPVLQRELDGDR